MKLDLFQYTSEAGWKEKPHGAQDENTAIFVFGGRSCLDQPQPFEDLSRAYPKALVIGCSSSGEIFGERVYDNTLSAAVATFEKTRLRKVEVSIDHSSSSRAVGSTLAQQLQAKDLRAVVVLSDGLTVNGSERVAGIRENLAQEVVVTGGLAGDGDRFEKTWVVVDSRPQSGWVTALGLYGDHVIVGHGSQGGWDAFGPEKIVTKAKNNILFELDGRPALQVYKDYLGSQADHLPGSALLFPLALRVPGHENRQIVRTVLSVDEKNNSMTFAGDVPMGSVTQLMRANMDKLVTGAFKAGIDAGEMIETQGPSLTLAISCVGRRMLLKDHVEDEVRATLRNLPADTKQIGFYSYGEISPHVQGECCELHNQTMTLTVIQEEN